MKIQQQTEIDFFYKPLRNRRVTNIVLGVSTLFFPALAALFYTAQVIPVNNMAQMQKLNHHLESKNISNVIYEPTSEGHINVHYQFNSGKDLIVSTNYHAKDINEQIMITKFSEKNDYNIVASLNNSHDLHDTIEKIVEIEEFIGIQKQ